MEHRRAWITVADGTRLAAQLWLPEERPAPVLLEALPYRMDDLTAAYASEYERLCEEGGFAVCRLDLRGTGSSEGIATDEYTAAGARRHLRGDRLARRAGLVERPRRHVRHLVVGLQLAPGRVPAPARARRDRADLRLGRPLHRRRPLHGRRAARRSTSSTRCSTWSPCNALPPVPAVFGDGWRDEWQRRVDEAEPWLLRWLEEQADGPYWRHGSVRPDYERITCPTMIVAGWADGYRTTRFRAFEALPLPEARADRPVEPHVDRDVAARAAHRPRPGADPLVRPLARATSRTASTRSRRSRCSRAARRGRRPTSPRCAASGAAEATWPPERLTRARRCVPPASGTRRRSTSAATSAARPGSRAPARLPWGQPDDQRADDALSLVYDWEPLAAELDVMGHPRVRLTVDLAGARRLPLGQALRRLPRRHVRARRAADPQPHPPRRPRRTARARARRADRDRDRARGDLVDLRARPSRAAVARRRRLAEHLAAAGAAQPLDGRSRQRRAACFRSSTGRAPLPPPVAAADDGHGHARAEPDERPASGRLAVRGRPDRPRDARGHVATARTTRRRSGRGSRSATRAPSASRRTIPRSPGRGAGPRTGSPGPRPTSVRRRRLDLRSDAEAYHVVIDARRRGARRARPTDANVPPRAAVRAHDPAAARVGAGSTRPEACAVSAHRRDRPRSCPGSAQPRDTQPRSRRRILGVGSARRYPSRSVIARVRRADSADGTGSRAGCASGPAPRR